MGRISWFLKSGVPYHWEIEEVLYKRPEVGECFVIGIPDKEYGEKVIACIVLKQKGLQLDRMELTNQFIILWTLETKSLLPSLYKREEFPLFGKEGLGEIFGRICLFNYGLLSKSFLKTHLPPFRVPKDFIFLDEIPKGSTGKILKRELRKQVMDHYDRRNQHDR